MLSKSLIQFSVDGQGCVPSLLLTNNKTDWGNQTKKLRHFLAKQSLYKDCYISAVRVHIGEGDGTPLQYSCLENLMDRGAW